MQRAASTPLPVLDGDRFDRRFHAELRAAPVIRTLQINIGYVCNLACRHCHVESSPARTADGENMSRATARRVVEWALAQDGLECVDITGGSPEMNPNFRWMVEAFDAAGLAVMDRCNPTIIVHRERDGSAPYEWVPAFLAEHGVHVVASLPCYLEDNVERQRGKGSYDASIEELRRLNVVGYGTDPRLRLTLVYNPVGPHLPPAQHDLERAYRKELHERFDLRFDELWTLTNMPIRRWRHELARDGGLEPYMRTLIEAFNEDTVEGLMCRSQVSIDPEGRMYDCDFNQAIDLPLADAPARYVWETTTAALAERFIATDDHCYGCTAGAGSSCGGAIA